MAVFFIVDSARAQAQELGAFFDGRFELRDALTFHVVNDAGRDFTVHIRWRDGQQSAMDRPLMVRIFDPEEELMERRFDTGKEVTGPAPWNAMQLAVSAERAGVYQIAVNGFAGAELEFRVDPPLKWGVYASPSLAIPVGQNVRGHFVRPNSPSLTIRAAGSLRRFSVHDQAGISHLELRHPQTTAAMSVASVIDATLPFQLQSDGRCEIEFPQQSVILCPDESTARVVGTSTTTLDDGTVCHHKFQVRAHELMARYRSLPPSAFVVPVPVLSRHSQAWLPEPERNKLLLGPSGVYAALDAVLREQNLDQSSPTFGQIYTWREGVPPRERFLPADGVLAAVHSIDAPFNPLHRNEALRNRIIIATLQDLMLLGEHELPDPTISLYAGGDRAFTFARMTRAFPMVVRDCPPEIRDVWTQAMMRYADRMSITQVANTVNQWSYIIRGLQHVAEGTGDSHYDQIVRMHIDWLLARNQHGHGRRAAGYFEESAGPDATYSGIALHNLSWVWERTRHQELGRALHDCFTLFNHTIAPEPNGVLLGTSSFCHRTGGTWLSVQSGGGVSMLADDSRAAAALLGKVWLSQSRARTAAQQRTRQQELLQMLRYLPASALRDPALGPAAIIGGPEVTFALWEHYANDPLDGELPVTADDRFTRAFGDEFFCVRRPNYYAFIYAGSTMADWQKSRRPGDPRELYPRNGGGLCMFWSPRFGSSINARNWSAFASHCLIAQHDSDADWEDYWSIDRHFDAVAATAGITGSIRNQPLAFDRQYTFHDDRIECALTISASQRSSLNAFSETFPFPLDKPGNLQIVLLDARGRRIQSGAASAIALQSPHSDEAHVIVFDQPRNCSITRENGADERGNRHEHGCIVTDLPSQWNADQWRTLRWHMMAVPKARVEPKVVATLAQMKR